MSEIEAKQRRELEFWQNSHHESPQTDTVHNIINKVSDAAVLVDCFHRYQRELSAAARVVELGAGQGWASCVFKRMFPQAQVTATDLSEVALQSLPKWERLWQVKLDSAYSCKSYQTSEADASVDVVFCFAAAHHFLLHDKTLREIKRILKPGGQAYYFYEPATPRLWYRLAHWRVNQNRPAVPEDVLVTTRLLGLARANGLMARVDYYPSLLKRAPLEGLYFLMLNRLPPLRKLLPCSVNFVFIKPA